jgi:hypothetical protein
MGDSSGHLQPYLARLRRRLVACRLAEGAGLGLAAGAVIYLLPAAWMLAQGQASGTALLLILPMSALAGALLALGRVPDKLGVALAADRQLGLEELLSTALATSGALAADPAFAAAVRSQAERAARLASAQRVHVQRLGGRAWGGIVVAVMLAGGVGLLSAHPLEPLPALGAGVAAAADGRGGGSPGSLAVVTGVRGTLGPGADPVSHQEQELEPARGAAAGGTGAAAAGTGAGGTGSAQTPARGLGEGPITGGTAARGGEGGAAGMGVGLAGGPGASGAAAGGTAGAGGLVNPMHAPAWNSSQWAQYQRQAQAGIATGRVPAEYADLVRRYYERP